MGRSHRCSSGGTEPQTTAICAGIVSARADRPTLRHAGSAGTGIRHAKADAETGDRVRGIGRPDQRRTTAPQAMETGNSYTGHRCTHRVYTGHRCTYRERIIARRRRPYGSLFSVGRAEGRRGAGGRGNPSKRMARILSAHDRLNRLVTGCQADSQSGARAHFGIPCGRRGQVFTLVVRKAQREDGCQVRELVENLPEVPHRQGEA